MFKNEFRWLLNQILKYMSQTSDIRDLVKIIVKILFYKSFVNQYEPPSLPLEM